MAKTTALQIDPQSGDLLIVVRKDRQGLISAGITIGDTSMQNQAIILQAEKGEFKEYPTMGVGITNIINDNQVTGWKREIIIQLESDSMTVNDVEIDIVNSKLSIDANYSS